MTQSIVRPHTRKPGLAVGVVLLAACGGKSGTMVDSPVADTPRADTKMGDSGPPTTTVTGQGFFGFVDGSGSGEFGLQSVVAVSSVSLEGSAEVVLEGHYSDDGTYTVPVIQGDATYAIGFQPLADLASFVTDVSAGPDFTTITWENPATVQIAVDPTPTTLEATGMVAWGAIDDMEILDPANGALDNSPQAAAPPTGKTTFTGTFDWNADEQLLEEGDTVYVWQLHTAGTAGNQYAAISNFGTLTAPAQSDGSSGGTLKVAMSAVTQNLSLAVTFDQTAFEALGSAVGSGAVDGLQDIVIDDAPFAYTTGPLFESETPDLVEWGEQTPLPAGSNVKQTFKYANPFTLTGSAGGTPLQPFLVLNYLFSVTVGPFSFNTGVTEFIPTDGITTLTLEPTISPVTNVLINGADIIGATGVGTAPTISWTAPATGTPTAYSVTVENVGPVGFSGGTVYTTETSVQMPPGVVAAGSDNSYVAIITAYVAPNWDVATTPSIIPMPVSECTMVTGTFSP